MLRRISIAHFCILNANGSDKSGWKSSILLDSDFLKLFGSNVNVGNISIDDVIPLETLRLGLRGDTFFTFLPESINKPI